MTVLRGHQGEAQAFLSLIPLFIPLPREALLAPLLSQVSNVFHLCSVIAYADWSHPR